MLATEHLLLGVIGTLITIIKMEKTVSYKFMVVQDGGHDLALLLLVSSVKNGSRTTTKKLSTPY